MGRVHRLTVEGAVPEVECNRNARHRYFSEQINLQYNSKKIHFVFWKSKSIKAVGQCHSFQKIYFIQWREAL